MNKATIKQMLQSANQAVTFVKNDGTKRIMFCTLKPELLPAPTVKPVGYVPRAENDEVLAVWDLDNSSWRSFRIDSILKITAI